MAASEGLVKETSLIKRPLMREITIHVMTRVKCAIEMQEVQSSRST